MASTLRSFSRSSRDTIRIASSQTTLRDGFSWTKPAMNEHELLLITDWFRRARESQRIHYECGTRYSRLNYLLGIPTIMLSAAVGTAVFASLDKDTSGSVRIILGLISMFAAVFASLQTFL